MARVAVNGPLPNDIGTGFAQVRSWQFAADLHPVVAAWFGSHFQEKQWVPTALLAYMVETGLLTKLQVAEAIVAFKKQTEVWLPASRDQACSVIGKFTQGAKADGRRLTRRLVADQGELDFLVRDCRQSGTLVGATEQSRLVGSSHTTTAASPSLPTSGLWRDKGETIFSPQDHAAYEPKPEHWGASNDVADSTAPSHADLLTRHALSYLNGGGGSDKTTRANELFLGRKPLVFTPTHRLAKEMRSRGVDAQTYHSFFR
ncbi:hypothetical protein RRG08_001030 [Elysia crispata]|uniref:Uncharacterized protein n=1 Tax=Elysia crispata TaxID=231223 RepID=A0AAE1E5L3_9GAST|nr:hypothetical protein RRG08_001030 [Elysia crispata]